MFPPRDLKYISCNHSQTEASGKSPLMDVRTIKRLLQKALQGCKSNLIIYTACKCIILKQRMLSWWIFRSIGLKHILHINDFTYEIFITFYNIMKYFLRFSKFHKSAWNLSFTFVELIFVHIVHNHLIFTQFCKKFPLVCM